MGRECLSQLAKGFWQSATLKINMEIMTQGRTVKKFGEVYKRLFEKHKTEDNH